MANKKNNVPIKTELIIDKLEFKTKLDERIKIGNEILNRQVTTKEELDVLSNDFSLWNDYNFEYLKQSFNNPNNEYLKTYKFTGHTILGSIEYNSNPILNEKEKIEAKINNLVKLKAKSDLIKSIVISNNEQNTTSNFIKDDIFIVHGHDDVAKEKTARFIEKLGFKPIILHEQASYGKTIIEKIEEYSNVGFGIILYTPCDVGAKNGNKTDLKSRARQNVVFEHGFLIGKIGRKNVCALVKGDVETPNDISGVVYVKMDDANAWHIDLAKEMRNSGYNIDMNKII